MGWIGDPVNSFLTDPSSRLDSSWNRSLLKWQMIWTSRQEMQGPQPPSRCSAQHYVRMASWCSKAGHVRSWRCQLPRLASTAMPRLEFHFYTLPSPPAVISANPLSYLALVLLPSGSWWSVLHSGHLFQLLHQPSASSSVPSCAPASLEPLPFSIFVCLQFFFVVLYALALVTLFPGLCFLYLSQFESL